MKTDPHFSALIRKSLRQAGKWRCVHPFFCDEPERNRSPESLAWLKTHSHRHACREIMVVLEGAGYYGVGNDLVRCRPGSVFFFDEGRAHQQGYPPSSTDCVHLWISLISQCAGARIITVRGGKLQAYGGLKYFRSYPEIGVWPSRCWPDEQTGNESTLLWRARLLSALAILLVDIVQNGFLPRPFSNSAAAADRTIRAIQDHIWQTGGRNATLDNLARISGFSKFHFLRQFKKLTGQSVHSFVNAARINKYHELLKARAAKKQMAEQLGFSCPPAFSRWLRQNIR